MSKLKNSQWPLRQADPAWRNVKMWVSSKVVEVHHRYNGASLQDAKQLVGDDTIKTQGCQLTCLAMTLRLLNRGGRSWTPATLNKKAKDLLFYSDALLSNVALYSDLVAEVSNGKVQVCMQEQYFSGEGVLPRRYASKCSILRGYRRLPPAQRHDFVIMLKMGTHDDSFASHYVLVAPNSPGAPDDNDVPLLDPDQPDEPRATPWCLSNADKRLRENEEIAAAWREARIRPLQLSGVWAFARLRAGSLDRRLLVSVAGDSRLDL